MSKTLKSSVEETYKDEINRLVANDKGPKPPGWVMSGQSVKNFIIGDRALDINRKFYGDDALVERAIVTLMGHQGLMLVGEPGTAKSLLSELLSAAISGDSQKIIQGTSGTTEDHIKYSWNFALLLSQGPSDQALIPSAIYHACTTGSIARFEELTRCSQEIQDALISIMSEKQMVVPELGRTITAKQGFNLIATANLRDRGVNDMSSALKRRFNFETVFPIKDIDLEKDLIRKQVNQRLIQQGNDFEVNKDMVDVLVTAFNDLRDEKSSLIKSLDAVLSTAEAVNIAYACSLQGHYMNESLNTGHLAQQMQGTIVKDKDDDRKKLAHYLDVVVRDRVKKDKKWKGFFEAGKSLWMN